MAITMSTSCARFFDLQELVDLLMTKLEQDNISRFACTCRAMHMCCTPSLFRHLDFKYRGDKMTLDLGFAELVNYYYCVLAFEEIDSQSTTKQRCATTDLDAAASCPHLSSDSLATHDALDPSTLGMAISRLSKIKRFELGVERHRNDWSQVVLHILSRCQSSIEHFSMSCVDEDISLRCFPLPKHSGPGEDENLDVMAALTRQEPLNNLEELMMGGMEDREMAAIIDIDVRSLLEDYPNIKKFVLPTIARHHDSDAIGEFIGKECSKIEELSYGSYRSEARGSLAFRLMGALPAQQLTGLRHHGSISSINESVFNIAIQQHSTTLRSIEIDGGTGTSKLSGSIIFTCHSLEKLIINYKEGLGY
ncbi:hypothetical protein BGX29_009716 [Mortierella sp. GBA35]|nr:hypothetical protein BGX29_009716 [Mortierella sp. GBA35]